MTVSGCRPDGAGYVCDRRDRHQRARWAALSESHAGCCQPVDVSSSNPGNKIVLSARLGASAVKFFDELLETAGIVVVPFDADMAKGAFEAFQRFGKGGGHPAQLNIVDCAVYALAKARSQPLLFKGADFAKTDIVAVLT